MYTHTNALREKVMFLDIDVNENIILHTLCDRANENDECWPAEETLEAYCHISLSTIKRSVKSLKEKGLISIRKYKTARGTWGNKYKVHVF